MVIWESTSGNRRDDADFVPVVQLGLLILEEANILFVHVNIDEAPHGARFIQQSFFNAGIADLQFGDGIAELQIRYPGIKERLLDETGAVRRFVNVYVNEEDIRFLQNQQTKLNDGDEISIIPAIAGG